MPSSYLTRVMIVEDSAVIRGMLTRILESDPSVKVVATAANGEAAQATYDRTSPDVVIMDIEMPVMDGLTALEILIKRHPEAKVVMCSTLTLKNAEISLKAMSLGAVDYIPKPTSTMDIHASSGFHDRLLTLVKSFAKHIRDAPQTEESASPAPVTARPLTPPSSAARFIPLSSQNDVTLRPEPNALWRPRVIAVGSSTGGPQALFQFFKQLKGVTGVPIVITQHMPPTFTGLLAQHITTNTGIECIEASEGTPLLQGRAHLARGGLHMLIKRNSSGQPCITLDDGPPENFCKPAVDPMLRSLVPVYGREILTVILTGMGTDGAEGSQAIVKAGGHAIAQDQRSSTVWGMPGAVASAGLCCKLGTPQELGAWVARRVK